MPTPCIDKFFMKLLEDELEELTKLSNSDKDNLAYKNQIDELQVDIYELVGSICRKSPEGNLVNEKREGVWTWYDEYNNPAQFGNYKNGLKEGLWIERHTDSNFETQMFYKNDVLDGKYTIYDFNYPYYLFFLKSSINR